LGSPICIEGRTLTTNLIVFNMEGFDIILEMDWLSNNHAIIDCRIKEIIFRLLTNTEFKFVGTKVSDTPQLISATQAKKLILEGCQVYLACLKESSHEEKKIGDDVQIYLTRKRTNRLQYSVCASARLNPQGIVLRKLISI
jgi:hypothetical protein